MTRRIPEWVIKYLLIPKIGNNKDYLGFTKRAQPMVPDLFDIVPAERREAARSALAAAFGPARGQTLERVHGGASGALIYRVEVPGRTVLLRMETRRDALRNPHQYRCMQTAAEAGIAPRLHHADDEAGVAVMDFLERRPLTEYPGGPTALASALGDLARGLQATTAFPFLADYPDLIGQLLAVARSRFAPGLLDPHAEGLERLRAAYPWEAAALVSSHNDPNASNIVFDGQRLWLIDWETAYCNDPLVDVAILANNHAATPELEAALLQAWLGRTPDRLLRARLTLMRQLTNLYYAALIFTVATPAGGEPFTSLDAPDPEAFRAAAEAGRLSSMGPNAVTILGLVYLNAFRAGVATPAFRDALAVARAG